MASKLKRESIRVEEFDNLPPVGSIAQAIKFFSKFPEHASYSYQSYQEDYGNYCEIKWSFWWYRPETDEELAKRQRKYDLEEPRRLKQKELEAKVAKLRTERKEKRERKLLEKLKKKYEKA